MSLVLSGSTSGSVTLQEPAVAGTTVIDLPATSGTMVVTGGAQTVQFAAGSASTPSITFTGDTNTGIFSPAADTIAFTEGGVESMRINSSGNVGIGTSSITGKLDIASSTASLNNGICFVAPDAAGADNGLLLSLRYGTNSTIRSSIGLAFENLVSNFNSYITFGTGTANTERMRIDSSGRVGIAKTPGTARLDIAQENNAYAPPAIRVNNVADDFSDIQVDIRSSAGYINGTNGKFIQCYSNNGTTTKAFIRGDGTYGSATNTYGSTSDIKLKTDIVDAGSQWDDIKAIKVRKYKKIDEPTLVQIGVIAQEIELVSPKLVDEELDYEEIDYEDEQGNVVRKRQATGTTTKSVKYSILYMKAVKALQEAMERIETIEAKVEAQAVRIAELEGAK